MDAYGYEGVIRNRILDYRSVCRHIYLKDLPFPTVQTGDASGYFVELNDAPEAVTHMAVHWNGLAARGGPTYYFLQYTAEFRFLGLTESYEFSRKHLRLSGGPQENGQDLVEDWDNWMQRVLHRFQECPPEWARQRLLQEYQQLYAIFSTPSGVALSDRLTALARALDQPLPARH